MWQSGPGGLEVIDRGALRANEDFDLSARLDDLERRQQETHLLAEEAAVEVQDLETEP